MSQEIEDRDDAVEYLQRKGFHAFKRDWIMGETVGVAAGLQPENNSGIKCWDHCIYIYKCGDQWAISDCANQFCEAATFENLQMATASAVQLMKHKSTNGRA
tara:strand:- start:3 stop:308 length:306 start_codon:yes stop_codon:yes gene_type:complete